MPFNGKQVAVIVVLSIVTSIITVAISKRMEA